MAKVYDARIIYVLEKFDEGLNKLFDVLETYWYLEDCKEAKQ